MSLSEEVVISSSNPLTWFPLKSCTRCGGSGTYSFNPMYGTMCFVCGTKPHVPGTGKAPANKKVANLLGEYGKELRAARSKVWQKLEVGDRVWLSVEGHVDYAKTRGGSWATVEKIEEDRSKAAGWKHYPEPGVYGPPMVTSWFLAITLEDGSVHRGSGGQVVRCCANVSPQPYVEAAWETVPVTVQKARKVVAAMMGRIG